MKRIILALFVAAFCFCGGLDATPIKIMKNNAGTLTRPKSQDIIPIQADVNNFIVSITFDYAVGPAYIGITDSDGFLKYIHLYNTDVETDISISLKDFESGEYELLIELGNNQTYYGFFEIY